MESVWYVVKVLPGKERSLNEEFNRQISIGHINNVIRFVCPTEKEFVLVKKKRVLRERVLYSGYLYFETPKPLNRDDLKEIAMLPNVMSMMGNKEPLVMSKTDIRRIIVDDRLEEHQESKKLYFSIGESITVIDGPFNTFNGVISDIKGDKIDVEIKIFGRNNIVSLNSNQIQKCNG